MISIQSFVAIAPPPDGVAGSNVYDPDTVTAVSLCPISDGGVVGVVVVPVDVTFPTPPRSRNGDAPGASRCTTPCPFGVTPTRFITPVNADGVHVITGASAATPASPTNHCWPAPSA